MAIVDNVAFAEGKEHGIIWAYRFDPDGVGRPVEKEPIDQVLAQANGWTWVHLALADHRCRDWLAASAPISATAREILTDPHEHLRLDIADGEIIGVIPDLEQALMHPTEDLVRLHFVLTDTMLITTRRHPAHAVELTRRAVDSGRRFRAPLAVLDAIIDQFASTVDQMIETLGTELDSIEQHVMHEELGTERLRLGKVRLQAVRMQRHLVQMRSLFHRIERRLREDHGAASVAIGALAQKIDELAHEATAVHERTRVLLDELSDKMSAITNKRLLTLTILTACLLPPTLVTGFFGMNTANLPFQETPGGTWYAGLLALAAGAVAYWAVSRLRE